MANGHVRLISAIPGSTSLRALVKDFCTKGQGVITAFSDTLLPRLHSAIDEDSLVDVQPFGEVVSHYLELSGAESLLLGSSGHVLAAVAEACRQVPDDSPFAASALFPGFHRALLNTLKELHDWGLLWDDLLEISEQLAEPLASKLRSMAEIDQETHRILGMLGRQTHAQQMRACFDSTPDLDGEFQHLLVFAGANESPLKLQWLQWAASHGTKVTVVMDRHATDGQIFRGAKSIQHQLGVKAREIGSANRLLNNLFSSTSHGGTVPSVTISSAADPLAESEWAIRAVADTPGSAAIYVRDIDLYAPLLEATAKRLGVPIRVSRRAPLLTNAFARTTLAVMRFAASDDVRKINTVAPSTYLMLNGDQQSELRRAAREAHGTKDTQWESLHQWAEQAGDSCKWITEVVRWRVENADLSLKLSEWASKFRALLDVLPWKANPFVPAGYAFSRDVRAANQMQRVLASHASIDLVAQAPPIGLKQFVDVCEKLWEASDVSVPAEEVGVLVSSHADGIDDVDTLVVLGMLEGVFPRRRSEDPILSDREREAISALRPDVQPIRSSHDRAAEERDTFYRVCAAGQKQLLFSYPQADDERDNVPAFYLELVEQSVPDQLKVDHPRSMIAPEAEACRCSADAQLRAALEAERETPLPAVIDDPEVQKSLQTSPDRPLNPYELRDAAQCPFLYIASHRLNLHPKRSSTRWAALRRLPQYATLATQADPVSAEKALEGALEAEIDKLISELPEWEVRLLRAGGRRLIDEWVRNEFAARKVWPKNADSMELNVRFGEHDVRGEPFKGLRIEGTIPAISQIDSIQVAHLYTSSLYQKDRPSDAEKLYLGLHMAALYGRGVHTAVEMQSMKGQRALYILTREGAGQLASSASDQVTVENLSKDFDGAAARKVFFEEVKRLAMSAASRIWNGDVTPMPGDHCDWCNFGELCRRHRLFGEDDSPFGEDMEGSDG